MSVQGPGTCKHFFGLAADAWPRKHKGGIVEQVQDTPNLPLALHVVKRC